MRPSVGGPWWLRPDYSDWIVGTGSGVCTDGCSDPLGVQAEAAYSHASYRINHCAVLFDRTDAILAMKRSLRARLEHLDLVLGLGDLPVSEDVQPKDWLGKLEALEIIRKGMLWRLNRLRNAIEHDGAEPPSGDECKDYHEILWYFLKVTAPYLRPPTDAELVPNKEDNNNVVFDCEISYKPFKIYMYGRFTDDYFSDKYEENWLQISVSQVDDLRTPDDSRDLYRIVAEIPDLESQISLLRTVFDKFV